MARWWRHGVSTVGWLLDGGNLSVRYFERWTSFTYAELIAHDKVNLDTSCLGGGSLDDLDSLPATEVIAREIVEDLAAALAGFEAVASTLERASSMPTRS